MQIIIPMTGNGSRFKEAGYKNLKPFINILNKPLIEWVVKMFPNEENIVFICREEHLQEMPEIEMILKRIKPTCSIFKIKNWIKKGPVYDVMQAQSVIDNNKPVIVNYCDFYMHWNFVDFKKTVFDAECDGAIPCYTGFHPHLIPKNNLYASCKVDQNNNLIEIKEKFSFEQNKAKGLHSVGTYYFKNGALLKKYYQKQIEQEIMLNGEYYSSLTYNLLTQDGLKTLVYDKVYKFCQWGTPEDLAESLFWIKNFKNI